MLDGGPAVPPGRKVLPTRQGYHRPPDLPLERRDLRAARRTRATRLPAFSSTGLISEPGTQLLTIAGAVQRPGVIETPTGIPLDTVLQFAGAMPGPVLLGGYHGRWLPQTTGVSLPTEAAGIVLALGYGDLPAR